MLIDSGAVRPDILTEHDLRGTIMHGGLGHLEMYWSPENDAEMRAFVEKMMAQQVTFFEVKRGLLFKRKRTLTHIDDLTGRRVFVGDDDVAKLHSDGTVQLTHRGGQVSTTGRILRKVQDIVTGTTVMARPLEGG